HTRSDRDWSSDVCSSDLTRWGKGDEGRIRAALFLLLTLPGRAILFQGDELGLEDGKVPRNRRLDCAKPPRDPERTPMPWTRSGRSEERRGGKEGRRRGCR